MSPESNPQKHRPSTTNVGTPQTPAAIASSVLLLSPAFTTGSAMRASGAASFSPSASAANSVGSEGSRPSAQMKSKTRRIERMLRRKSQRDSVPPREPQNLAIGELALARDLRRTQRPGLIQEGAQQHGLATHVDAGRQRREARALQICIGRDEIEIPVERSHQPTPIGRRAPWVAVRARRRRAPCGGREPVGRHPSPPRPSRRSHPLS
jgi:hypothetical protein